ncbi:MAG: hypothetical protein EXR71_02710 [Myxococcales bacterium]|nr:hypothetical protein [Myxococcales bacterium]
MRGLLGMVTVVTLLAWVSLQSAAILDGMQDRADTLTAAADARERYLGMTPAPIVEKGRRNTDWKALLGDDGMQASGQRQRAVWKEQTRRLLAGEPVTEAERALALNAASPRRASRSAR